jgi:thiamine-monophosphate kinase
MSLTEFQLIQQFFNNIRPSRDDVKIGIGDDCALLQCPSDKSLAVTIDTLVEGVHFPVNTQPKSIGHKALAVGLSDLAAMGAEPAWATLALTLPQSDVSWVAEFCEGFFTLADKYDVELIGGDTTQGPLTITVQLHGFVPQGMALRRDGAKVGDLIFVSGKIGAAGIGLLLVEEKLEFPESAREQKQSLINSLNNPIPRIETGQQLRGIANACIDVSDGLVADLNHILEASSVGASIDIERIPIPSYVKELEKKIGGWQQLLSSGDDYELCFCIPPAKLPNLNKLSETINCPITEIGVIESIAGLRIQQDGQTIAFEAMGFEHFSGK